jgi:hypothetical protein
MAVDGAGNDGGNDGGNAGGNAGLEASMTWLRAPSDFKTHEEGAPGKSVSVLLLRPWRQNAHE